MKGKTRSKAVPGLSDEKFMEAAVVLKTIVRAMLAQLSASEGARKGAK